LNPSNPTFLLQDQHRVVSVWIFFGSSPLSSVGSVVVGVMVGVGVEVEGEEGVGSVIGVGATGSGCVGLTGSVVASLCCRPCTSL